MGVLHVKCLDDRLHDDLRHMAIDEHLPLTLLVIEILGKARDEWKQAQAREPR
jgi:hypothetical protein